MNNIIKWISRQSKIVKVILTLMGICCIGLVILFILGSMMPDSMIFGDISESKLFENEYLSFKYPGSFIDITIFHSDAKEGKTFYSIFSDEGGKNGLIVSSREIDPQMVPTFLDEFYENLKTDGSQRSSLKMFELEKIEFHGIPALKATEEHAKHDRYRIILSFVRNNDLYTIYISGNDNKTVNYVYELIDSSIVLK